MLVPTRYGFSNEYRYGFNGKEKDDEIKNGDGNSYDFGARIYDPRVGRWFSEDPLFHAQPSSSSYSFANNNPIVLIDPDGELPIIPLLIKAGAAGAADLMMQVAMSYYFDSDVESIGQAFDKVDYLQVSRSAAEGLIPWRVPGGRLGKAAATAVGDVLVNVTKAGLTGGEYSKSQAVQDFTVGFLSDLAGGAIGDLVTKYGGNKVRQVFSKLGLPEPKIEWTAKLDADGKFGRSRYKYRANLEAFSGVKPKKGQHAHHMLPKNKKFAEFFKENGIDVNDPQFMKWMDPGKGPGSHSGKFSAEYNKFWSDFIENSRGKKYSKKTLMKKAKDFEKKAQTIAKKHYGRKKL